MTTIPPLLEESHTDPLQVGRRNGNSQQKSKWLYELERAQWQHQPRTAAPNRPASDAGHAQHDSPEANAGIHKQAAISEQEFTHPYHRIQSNHPHDVSPRLTPLTQMAHGAIDDTLSTQAAAMANISLLAQSGGSASSPADIQGAAPSSAGYSIDRRWEKQRAYLEEKQGEVSLWLRDTRINENQGLQLAAALQKRFAELGQHLAHFTLNGHKIAFEPEFNPNKYTK